MKIQFVKDIFDGETYIGSRVLRKDLAPGTAQLSQNGGPAAVLYFVCPCGCSNLAGLPLNQETGNYWKWDGNKEEPTLAPSIVNEHCGWHGFLIKGEWTNC